MRLLVVFQRKVRLTLKSQDSIQVCVDVVLGSSLSVRQPMVFQGQVRLAVNPARLYKHVWTLSWGVRYLCDCL